ncbi:MAG TPA: hypothetical protein VGK97_06660 [Spongiibacteraceae bacterium]|jgi:hypothetical protein
MLIIKNRFLFGLFISALLTSCGGGGGGSSSNNSASNTPPPSDIPPVEPPPGNEVTLTGAFIDSPVENLHYRTATQSGTTDASGHFKYKVGEQIIFSIGAIDFPLIAGQTTITPWDVLPHITDAYRTPQYTNLTNMLRLLQTLDRDGDPNNGIQIDDIAHSTAANFSLSFDSSSFDSDVAALVTRSGSGQIQLVSADQALVHFNKAFLPLQLSRLVGVWEFGREDWYRGGVASIVTFVDDTHYVAIEPHVNAGSGLGSGELAGVARFGTFTWDPLYGGAFQPPSTYIGSFNMTASGTNNPGSYGYLAGSGSIDLDIRDNNMVLGLAADKVVGSKVLNAESPILGSWVVQNVGAASATFVLTFLPDGTYFIAANGDELADPSGQDGYEKGTYTWTASSGVISTTALEGTGIWRLNDGMGTFVISAHPPSSANAPDRGPDTAVWASGASSVEFTHVGL